MRIGNKPPISVTTSDAAARALGRLSKSALIDLYTHALAGLLGSVDRPPTVAEIGDDARPLLSLRGDPVPKAIQSGPDRWT